MYKQAIQDYRLICVVFGNPKYGGALFDDTYAHPTLIGYRLAQFVLT